MLLAELEDVLKERHRRGEITALVVDEAQTLSPELLEEIRLLANIETPSDEAPAVDIGGAARALPEAERAGGSGSSSSESP